MDHKAQHFDVIGIREEDYRGLSPKEAYSRGVEIGCFIQAVSLSKQCDETLRIKIPSEQAERVLRVLESLEEEGKFFWINDDVMEVVIER